MNIFYLMIINIYILVPRSWTASRTTPPDYNGPQRSHELPELFSESGYQHTRRNKRNEEGSIIVSYLEKRCT